MADPEKSSITPEAILAYLDGADLPHVAAYLRTSPEGAMLAADYATVAGNLTRALYRHECPPTQHLGDYALALLPACASTDAPMTDTPAPPFARIEPKTIEQLGRTRARWL